MRTFDKKLSEQSGVVARLASGENIAPKTVDRWSRMAGPDLDGIRVVSIGVGARAAKCPCCGLPVAMDMLVDVSGLDDELTGGAKWACSGCMDGWVRRGKTLNGQAVSRADIYEALGETVDRNHIYWSKKKP